MSFTTRILLALTVSVISMTCARAADYDPPIYVDQAAEYVPVEVGSGWYLRGDVGYSVNDPYDYYETPDGFTSSVIPISGSIGMGYHFNDFVRGELNFGLLPTSKFSNDYITVCGGTETTTVTNNADSSIVSSVSGPGNRPCPGSDNANNKAYQFMANAYVDLGTYVGITPYIGGGLGVAYSTYSSAQGARDCNSDSSSTVGGGTTTTTSFDCFDSSVYRGAVESERQYSLAYSLGAGFAYRVSQNVSVDLGYEYFAVPQARYASFDSGGVSIREGIDYHQVKLGLRYDLW